MLKLMSRKWYRKIKSLFHSGLLMLLDLKSRELSRKIKLVKFVEKEVPLTPTPVINVKE